MTVSMPKTFNEAVSIVVKAMKESADYDIIMSTIPEKINLSVHNDYGRTIRNSFGLWDDDSELTNHLKRMGFRHAKDMSSAIIISAANDIQGRPRNLSEMIRKSNEYWDRVNMDEALR